MLNFRTRKLSPTFLQILAILNTLIIVSLLFFKKDFKEIIEVTAICVSAFIAFLVYQSQIQKDRFDYTMQRPLLNFVNIPKDGKDWWVVLNVGNGPALNIRFMGKSRASWGQPVIGYAIPPNLALIISPEIEGHGTALSVYYKDLFGKEYMVYCEGDTNSIVCEKGEKEWNDDLFNKIHSNVKRGVNLQFTTLKERL